ncbi:MAG: PstS family phosphate ABC transporter substrate-binding protein [Candidatus Caldatribacterium sp.]|nr:PstS family phosphate ABC transporter substrate-binding protein [Candidatus Caldatribacterium sp.]MCX7730706.1 PstS family phosphate ABC transporter substrate-binding protein [Candidatus Caldatribacterium sp.]MDW8080326.1 PstS family phosphate ABC transporter substrate-binding protein [Candidatus Calescibacterium sp.]
MFSVAAFAAEKVVQIDGSSTVYPITEAVAEEFQKAYKDIKVTVGISGTGGGFKRFARGETDISNASRPIKASEIEACQANGIDFIELPIAFDAIAVVVHPENDWVDYLTVEELKKMWEPEAQGKALRWSDIRPGWPDKPITLFGPGVDSGTFEYFTEAIVGEAKKSRGDYVASEDDNVLVQGVSQDKYALGYFGLAYYIENQDILKAVPIKKGDGDPVLPTPENVEKGLYQPLSRPLFIYVNAKSAEREEVARFVEFYLKNAPQLVKEVGYVPLPQKAYELALERFTKRVTGTVFGGRGATVGVSIEELLKKEAQ